MAVRQSNLHQPLLLKIQLEVPLDRLAGKSRLCGEDGEVAPHFLLHDPENL